MQRSKSIGKPNEEGDISIPQCGESEEFYKILVKVNPNYLRYANDKFRNNSEILTAALTSSNVGELPVLFYAGDKLRDDFNLVLIAVSLDGKNLEYASDRLRDNSLIVLWATRNTPQAVCMASDRLLNDPEFATLFLSDNDANGLQSFGDKLRKNEAFILEQFIKTPNIFESIHPDLRINKEFILKLLDKIATSISRCDASVTIENSFPQRGGDDSVTIENSPNRINSPLKTPKIIDGMSYELQHDVDLLLKIFEVMKLEYKHFDDMLAYLFATGNFGKYSVCNYNMLPKNVDFMVALARKFNLKLTDTKALGSRFERAYFGKKIK